MKWAPCDVLLLLRLLSWRQHPLCSSLQAVRFLTCPGCFCLFRGKGPWCLMVEAHCVALQSAAGCSRSFLLRCTEEALPWARMYKGNVTCLGNQTRPNSSPWQRTAATWQTMICERGEVSPLQATANLIFLCFLQRLWPFNLQLNSKERIPV